MLIELRDEDTISVMTEAKIAEQNFNYADEDHINSAIWQYNSVFGTGERAQNPEEKVSGKLGLYYKNQRRKSDNEEQDCYNKNNFFGNIINRFLLLIRDLLDN